MTVDELVAALAILQAEGHGSAQVWATSYLEPAGYTHRLTLPRPNGPDEPDTDSYLSIWAE